MRALAEAGIRPDLVILDGNHDWLTAPAGRRAVRVRRRRTGGDPAGDDDQGEPEVLVGRRYGLGAGQGAPHDAIMAGLGEQHPAYGWGENKGYAAPGHLDALRQLGPCEHRRSWRLPGA